MKVPDRIMVKYYVLLLVVVFLLGGILISCTNNELEIQSIDVYAIKWFTFTEYSYDSEIIINHRKRKHFKIENEKDLNLISKRLTKLKPLEGYNDLDVRMVCHINYSDGSKDELCFGTTIVSKYKGAIYEKDTILINTIEKYSTVDNSIPKRFRKK